MEIHYLDKNAAEESSRIYRDLKTKGKKINENDILIAGIALSNNELLITRDTGFNNIEENDNRIRIV